MADTGPFIFTLTDLARFLGKSPVTIRGWERQGLVELPRQGTDRKLTVAEVKALAVWAETANRISTYRLRVVTEALTMLNQIEQENKDKIVKHSNRPARGPRIRQERSSNGSG